MLQKLKGQVAGVFDLLHRFRPETLDLNDRYQEVLEASSSGIFEWDLVKKRIYGSQRTFEILSLECDAGWIDEKKVLRTFPQSERDRVLSIQVKLDASDELRRVETHCIDSKGNKVFVHLRGKVFYGRSGNIERIVGSINDVSERKKLEQRLRHEALHDFLTGLPNRTLLVDRIQHILTRLKRNSDLNAALLFMDVDNFKAVNDNLGHGFGDDVLVAIGEKLTDIVRAADTVSRIGSDEFVILLEDPTTAKIAHKFATRLLEKMQEPLSVQNKVVNPTFSIGLVLIDDPDVSVETLLGDADIAMYAAKNNGKGQVVPFDATMRIQAAKRLDIETALRQAISQDELYLAYQPIFTIDQKKEPKAVGVEALLRWTKSDRGNIAPGELLAVAEENGMIEDIGLWVIDTATEQLEKWYSQGFPMDCYININLSSRHFDDEAIVDYLLWKIDQRQLPRWGIRLEIVESAVIRNPEKALSVIERLRREGIYVSIDDFGTGFSSLSYLHRFPFYALKIDRSFVVDVIESKASQDIVAAIVLMARKLQIRVVAEGIENEKQLEFLKSVGCEMVQGFLLGKPMVDVGKFFIDQPRNESLVDNESVEKLPAYA